MDTSPSALKATPQAEQTFSPSRSMRCGAIIFVDIPLFTIRRERTPVARQIAPRSADSAVDFYEQAPLFWLTSWVRALTVFTHYIANRLRGSSLSFVAMTDFLLDYRTGNLEVDH